MTDGAELGARLRDGDLRAAPAVLNLVETARRPRAGRRRCCARSPPPRWAARRAPTSSASPGRRARASRRCWASSCARGAPAGAASRCSPSTRRRGARAASLLGDRARIAFDPADGGVFIRSTAAAGRLGGLAPATRAAAHALAAAFDVVVIETVGVGQSETDVAEVADTVAVIVQPGSGDVLQFLKAGIMEIPDVLVVTKADLGDVAQRARRDLHAALRSLGDRETEVVAVSSIAPVTGIDELVAALDAHRERLDLRRGGWRARRASALADFAAEHGERGLRALGGRRAAERALADADPGADVPALVAALEGQAAGA